VKWLLAKATFGLLTVLLVSFAVATYHSTSSARIGSPGLGMQVVETNIALEEKLAANAVPTPLPPAEKGGVLAVNAYKNVQVLGHISAGEFTRLMTSITQWVAPNQGCAYCHAPQRDAAGKPVVDEEGTVQADLNNMQSDELYTKRVARRMLQMTMRINGEWKLHVKETGVTCYTCHRGNPVPANIWFDIPDTGDSEGAMGNRAGQNAPSTVAGLASLPGASLRPYLVNDENIRVLSTEAVGSDNRRSIKETEWTYSLMIHMSKSLGVNCTYCHNTRSMAAWSASPPARTQAYYGIRMVRELNNAYLEPLHDTFPAERLGTIGDVPKVNCATCHAGAYKPLLGASMLKDFQVLAAAKPQPPKTANLQGDPAPAGTGVPAVPVPSPDTLNVAPGNDGASDAGRPPALQPAPAPPPPSSTGRAPVRP